MTDSSESQHTDPPPGYRTPSAGNTDRNHDEESELESSKSAPSNHSFPEGYETQLDLLQRRFNNKTGTV
jgi:hypothetical protein